MEADQGKKIDSMATVSSELPITARRKLRSDLETYIPKPYLARAFVCPSTEHPHGTPPLKHPEMTVLERHVAFFDWDNDGVIYAWDIYKGLRLLGFNMIMAFVFCILVATMFSYPTMPGYIPSLFFAIHIKNIHKTTHGSASRTYDSEGRFVPVNFENMFSKYAHTVQDKFTLRELWNLSEGNRSMLDIVGSISNKLEWGFLYYLAMDENGLVSKEDIRNCYDGTLFEQIAKRRRDHKATTSLE